MILGANHEAESVPIIGHPVSAILGTNHEAESGPISGDTGYFPILDWLELVGSDRRRNHGWVLERYFIPV